MAKIKFLTKPSKQSKKALTGIYVRVWNGRKFDQIRKTNLVILPDNWNNENETIRQRADFKGKDELKAKLTNLKRHLEDAYNQLIDVENINKNWLKTEIDKFSNPNKYLQKEHTLFSFIENFVEKADNRINLKTGRPVSYKMKREYQRTFEYLKEFSIEKDIELDFRDIDLDFYENFIEFLQKRNLANNTIGKKIQTLKIFLNEATERGINTNIKFKSNRFRVISEEAETIYLNEKELQQIYNLDLSDNSRLEKVRDLFLIGCWTGLRFSDWCKVSADKIKGNVIQIEQQKTSNKVAIPIHDIVKEILNKNKGVLPKNISNQKFNEYIKEIAKKAEITSIEHKAITKGGKRISLKYKKWELVSSHTARRSFATNLYNQGLDTLTIMSITGHKTSQAFLKYIKVTPEEHAEKVIEHWRNNKLRIVS